MLFSKAFDLWSQADEGKTRLALSTMAVTLVKNSMKAPRAIIHCLIPRP
jgi:hypothetical protein